MRRFLQLHLLTFYPPSNPNRDDTGKPKTAVVGGYPRQRLSSQSLKRAWRTSEVFSRTLSDRLGVRTQRFGTEIEKHLLDQGIAADKARQVARDVGSIFGQIEKESDKNPTYTKQLAFISPEERKAALDLADRRAAGEDVTPPQDLPATILRATDTAADIAMFGRMLADHPDFNREAAVSVAHAFTTNRVVVDDDFYTAVDDLKQPSEGAGASFIGDAGFGSGVFYLYLVIDRRLLIENLGGDVELAKTAIEALVEAAATVGPAGKAKSYASYAYTQFVLAELGEMAPRNLAAAFIKPVDLPDDAGGKPNDLFAVSVKALKKTQERMAFAYSEDNDVEAFDFTEGEKKLLDVVQHAVKDLR